MANYYASARSSYFKPKDVEAFKRFCAEWNLAFYDKGDLVGFGVEGDQGSGGVPDFPEKREGTDYTQEYDFYGELATHIDPEWAAIIMEVGAEKLRYLVGSAVVVSAEGIIDSVDLNGEAERIASDAVLKSTSVAY